MACYEGFYKKYYVTTQNNGVIEIRASSYEDARRLAKEMTNNDRLISIKSKHGPTYVFVDVVPSVRGNKTGILI